MDYLGSKNLPSLSLHSPKEPFIHYFFFFASIIMVITVIYYHKCNLHYLLHIFIVFSISRTLWPARMPKKSRLLREGG